MCDVPAHFGDAVLVPREEELYAPLDGYLHTGFFGNLQPKHGWMRIFTSHVAQTPAPDGGMWTRPDLAAVVLRRRKYATSVDLDTLSFEVKSFAGASIQGVHEALAHTRFMNQSYFVWNRPACVCADRERFDNILENCRAYGIGLITIHNPSDLTTFSLRLHAAQNQISGDTLDNFIESRFSIESKTQIIEAMRRFLRELP
jgi:hypothetical protein